jgi:hypothetical protein
LYTPQDRDCSKICWENRADNDIFAENRFNCLRYTLCDKELVDRETAATAPRAFGGCNYFSSSGIRVLDVHQTFRKDGSALQQITTGPGWNTFAAWSSNRRYIAYLHFDTTPNMNGGTSMLFDTRSGVSRQLMSDETRCAFSRPAWKPFRNWWTMNRRMH